MDIKIPLRQRIVAPWQGQGARGTLTTSSLAVFVTGVRICKKFVTQKMPILVEYYTNHQTAAWEKRYILKEGDDVTNDLLWMGLSKMLNNEWARRWVAERNSLLSDLRIIAGDNASTADNNGRNTKSNNDGGDRAKNIHDDDDDDFLASFPPPKVRCFDVVGLERPDQAFIEYVPSIFHDMVEVDSAGFHPFICAS